MSDRGEITALVHSYAYLLDEGEVDAVAALFEHATWRSDSRDAVLRGSAEVRPVYEAMGPSGDGLRSRHLLTNLTVDVDPGATTATSRCYWTVLRDDPGQGIRITLSGRYDDRFDKVDGRWRFADRLIRVDLGGSQSGP